MRRWVGLTALWLWGCPTGDPDIDSARFRCETDEQCALGFRCLQGICSTAQPKPMNDAGEDASVPDGGEPKVEVCGNGADDDGDGLRDCADPDCLDETCDDQDACTVLDRCRAEGSCRGDELICNGNTGECPGGCIDGGCDYRATVGSPCDAGSCRGDGVCGPGETNCFDTLDNDGDSRVDCADSDCVNQLCDRRACQTNYLCLPSIGCSGPPTCAPPQPCHSAGACVSDGGCTYGISSDVACDDFAACTHTDLCTTGGVCVGTTYSCASPPTECHGGGVCQGDGGCNYSVQAGQPCSGGGLCTADGGCGPRAFSYAPSNFDPTAIAPSGPLALPACQATFDSDTATFINLSGAGCPSTAPAVMVVDAGVGNIVVLAAQALTIESVSSLNLVGNRAVVLAVYGDAVISGALLANSARLPLRRGAGTNRLCGAEPGENGTWNQSGGGGGGAGNRTAGGAGGSGTGSSSPGGAAGQARSALLPVPLRGGCAGGRGAANGGSFVQGGAGGGALQLSVAGKLTVAGVVSSSAMGGNGSPGMGAAGGGGGSGGTVFLEANELVLSSSARITSNGGAGGGGAENGSAGDGVDGTTNSDVPAVGGTGQGRGGSGGQGGAGSSSPTNGADAASCGSCNAGGGGGGGAAGQIFLRSIAVDCTKAGALISPSSIDLGRCP
ncbi:MAG: hypothetical protein ACOZIN_14090 [Myxococcota bacterium]